MGARTEAKDERIRAALFELAVEHGYARIDLPDVLKRAGVDKAEFLQHFPSLADCYCAVLDEFSVEYLAMVEGAFRAESGWRNQIRAAAHAITRWLFREEPERARFIMVELHSVGECAERIRYRTMAVMVDLIDAGREEMDDPSSLSRATAEAIGGTVYTALWRLVAEAAPAEQVEAVIPQLMHAVVLPYLGEEAAKEELEIPVSASDDKPEDQD